MKKEKELKKQIDLLLVEKYGKYSRELAKNGRMQLRAYDYLCKWYRNRFSKRDFGRVRILIENMMFADK